MSALPEPILTEAARRWLRRVGEVVARVGWTVLDRGEDGMALGTPSGGLRVIASATEELDGRTWAHVSVSNSVGTIPTYNDLKRVHAVVLADLVAYQLFVPADEHVNIHSACLHLWACLDGPVTPDFTRGTGSI